MGRLDDSVQYLRTSVRLHPETAVVLGSGLGQFAERLTGKIVFDCADVPDYPVPHVEGHAGKLVFGRVMLPSSRSGPFILLFVGRPHFYESGDLGRVTYPIRVAHELGIKNLILTNAAGAVNPTFVPGDLMIITGHINLTLEAPKLDLPRLGSIKIYNEALTGLAWTAARRKKIAVKEGIYCGVSGPSYETGAEIQMIRRLGADAVGMSTVHEATVASSLGVRVLGISLITNLATGLTPEPATHDDVIRVARQAKKRFEMLLTSVLSLLDDQETRRK
jgi:purine-nucleoside phosphorylase